MPPPEPPRPRLGELQRGFAQGLRANALDSAPAVLAETAPIGARERFEVYRNNGRVTFRNALGLTFPVLLRRVGDPFFAQLAHEYHACHPSRTGDLHFAGAAFPEWLAGRLGDTEYAWLADLARLEWACEDAATAPVRPAATLELLGSVDPESLEEARVELQPSLRLVASDWPVGSVWQANQGAADAAPVDLAAGAEHCVCACLDEGVVTWRLAPDDHAVLAALQRGATLAEAAATVDDGAEVLARVLGWAFAERLVVAISPSAPA